VPICQAENDGKVLTFFLNNLIGPMGLPFLLLLRKGVSCRWVKIRQISLTRRFNIRFRTLLETFDVYIGKESARKTQEFVEYL
jgi:hypothetical protein